ncbi:hypothetical protein [Vibrio alginolyticus]|uniref:hypothetical protein n=1 Tax=Vibrio alginolyticus TaxID=663 RepID=UPI00211A1DB2|nr:hypothetical protein [Vibrio alginolyticus]MCQ9090975.1 hypothetical protein [Vibrio alginolyticus]
MTEDIDPKIKPLVDALNRFESIATLYSCQGHVQQLSDPYILFRSSQTQAASLHQTLLRLWRQGKTHTRWAVSASFNAHNELRYRLYGVRYSQHFCQFWLWRCWHFGIHRHLIDQDINTLTLVFNEQSKPTT